MVEVDGDAISRCILCGGKNVLCFQAQDVLRTTRQRFSILRCHRCGLHSLSPRPSLQEALGFYPSNYEPFHSLSRPEPNVWQRWLRRRHWQLRCKAVRSFQDGGTLLDVGCGTGEFLAALRRSGDWQVVGVEVNERAGRYAQQTLGLSVHLGELSALTLPQDTFDVVTMWNVLEHVPDPLGTLNSIARLLRPGGMLFLSTPNAQSWQAHLWKKWWAGWDLPRHLCIFTLQTLEQSLGRYGMRIVKRLYFPAERFYFAESWQRFGTARFPFGQSHQRWIKRLAVATGVMLWPALRLLDFTDRASHIAVAAMLVPDLRRCNSAQ